MRAGLTHWGRPPNPSLQPTALSSIALKGARHLQGVFLCVIRPQSLAAAELPSVTDEFSRPMSGAQICPQRGAITDSKFLYCGAGRVVEIAANGVFAKIDLDTAKPRRDAAFGVISFRYKKLPSSFSNLRGVYFIRIIFPHIK